MEEVNIEKINWISGQLEKGRIKLSLGQSIAHYRLLFIPVSVCFGLIIAYLSSGSIEIDLTILILVFAISTILYFVNQWKSLRIIAIKMPINEEQYKRALLAASIINEVPLEWIFDESISEKESSGKFAWTSYSRFIHLQKEVLYLRKGIKINNEKLRLPFIPKQKHLRVIIDCLQKEKEGLDTVLYAKSLSSDREMKFWKESEWTFGRVLKRIIVYFFGLVFLAVFVLFLSEDEYFGSLIIVGPIVLVIISVRSDFEIIRLKRRKRKNRKNRKLRKG